MPIPAYYDEPGPAHQRAERVWNVIARAGVDGLDAVGIACRISLYQAQIVATVDALLKAGRLEVVAEGRWRACDPPA